MRAKIKYILAAVMISVSLSVMADDNVSMIVTNDGETLKVYNIDYSPADYCYYTLEANSDDLKRIKKSDILIIKLADGTKVDLSNTAAKLQSSSHSSDYSNNTPADSQTIKLKTPYPKTFSELYSLSGKKEYCNMTSEELSNLYQANEYDILYDYSEAGINNLSYRDFIKYYKPESGLPANELLEKFERTMVFCLNNGIPEYNFSITENPKNRFKIVVKFNTITEDAKSYGIVIAEDKISGNIAFKKFTTKAGRWNSFENLLMEDAGNPFVNAPDRYSIYFVSQAIENAVYNFRKKGKKIANR